MGLGGGFYRVCLVERVYVLAHMILDPASGVDPVKGNKPLQTTLSCAFSHLVVSIHDPNAAVAQRAILALKSMPSTSLSVRLQMKWQQN